MGTRDTPNSLNATRAVTLRFERARLVLALADDREVSVPLDWYPTLRKASPAARSRWRMIGNGQGFHWPDLDLDLSVAGLTQGLKESIPRPPAALRLANRQAKPIRRKSA
jgi:hypothetical protein